MLDIHLLYVVTKVATTVCHCVPCNKLLNKKKITHDCCKLSHICHISHDTIIIMVIYHILQKDIENSILIILFHIITICNIHSLRVS